MTTLMHRVTTDGLATICGQPSDTLAVAGLLDTDEVTCPVCKRHATLPDDPAYVLLRDGVTSTTDAPYRAGCYICRDPEYAMMGLPLCRKCPACGGHIPADDISCDDCTYEDGPEGYGGGDSDLAVPPGGHPPGDE